MIRFQGAQLAKLFDYAHQADPAECCGLIGGRDDESATVIYPLRNLASEPNDAYEAAPEDLFAAQRQMRERGEQLLGIYHSHPRSAEPRPSETDVRLAYYPRAVYFIIGLGGARPVMRAFRISESVDQWEEVEYVIAGE